MYGTVNYRYKFYGIPQFDDEGPFYVKDSFTLRVADNGCGLASKKDWSECNIERGCLPYCNSEGHCVPLGYQHAECGYDQPPCADAFDCIAGVCEWNRQSYCRSNADCGREWFCTSAKVCVPEGSCLSDYDCNGDGENYCVKTPGYDYSWRCAPKMENGQEPCYANTECVSGLECIDSTCQAAPPATTTTSAADPRSTTTSAADPRSTTTSAASHG